MVRCAHGLDVMMLRGKAMGRTRLVAAAVVVIIVGAIGLATLGSQQGKSSLATSKATTPMSSTTSTSSKSPTSSTFSTSSTMSTISYTSSASSAVYQMVGRNLTLKSQTANIPCTVLYTGCPPANNASISQVEPIKYGTFFFYQYNQTAITGAPLSGEHPVQIAVYTVWFTNSTVFCISPAHPLTNTEQQIPTCPTLPYGTKIVVMPTPSVSTINSTSGLRLNLTLSTNSSGMVTVAVHELNTLVNVNNVTAAHHWPINATWDLFLWTQGYCGPGPVGYEILQGNYGRDNVTKAAPISLDAEPVLGCPAQTPISSYVFAPLSDMAAACQAARCGRSATVAASYSSSGAATWSGFWTGSAWEQGAGQIFGGNCPDLNPTKNCPLVFNPLSAGAYTVLAADEWGQVLLLHFVVQDG
jgi:hypothetical protein